MLETPDLGDRLRLLIEWTRAYDAEDEVNDKISQDVREGLEKNQREFLLRQQLAAIRKELGEGEPDGSDDYRARVEAADLPEAVREAALREVDKLERSSEQAPEAGWIRTWLDTVLELPWNERTEDSARRRRRPRGARRRPPRPRRGQGPHHRVPRRACSSRRARPRGDRRSRLRRRGAARRSSRRRQDLARRVRRPGTGPHVRPRRPRRRARRGRDPRPPAHVRRRPARPHRAGDQGGRLDEPGRPARRGRQGRRGLPRRPRRGAARGARPGAEPHVPRPLPRARPRPVRRALHRHRQRGRADPVGPAGPHGARHHRRLHRGRQGRHRARLPDPAPAGAGGADPRRGHRLRRRPRRDRGQLHPRGRRTPARAAAGQGVPQGRHPARDRRRRAARHRPRRARGPGRAAALHARQPRADRRARCRHRPRRDRPRRRRALRRDVRVSRQGGAHRHRPARRRDEGVGLDRAVLGARARGRARDRPGRVRAVDPRALPGRRDPQGRPVRGRHDGDRPRLAAHRTTRALRRRHDRRGHALGAGAADRRREAEAARRPAGRSDDGLTSRSATAPTSTTYPPSCSASSTCVRSGG